MEKIRAWAQPLIRTIFSDARAQISLLIILLGIVLSVVLLWTQQRSFLGPLHEPHTDSRSLHVKPGREFRQTFVSQGATIEGIMLFVQLPEHLGKDGELQVTLRDDTHTSIGSIKREDIFPDGDVYVPFSPAFHASRGESAVMNITSTGDIDLQYQIDASKYEDGKLSLFIGKTQTEKDVEGDMAFQMHYRGPIARIVHLTPAITVALVVGILTLWVAWLALLHAPPRKELAFSFTWNIHDTIAGIALIIFVGLVYGVSFFSQGVTWSTNRDYAKDVTYLRSSVEGFTSGALPSWQMNMCGGQPLLGNPESSTLSAGTLIAAIAGPVVGVKIWLLVETLIAAIGAYLCARLFGASSVGSFFAGMLFVLSGFIPYRALTATMFVAGAAAVPWMIFTYMKSLTSIRWLLVCALVAVAAFFAGDTHGIAYALVAIGILSVFFVMRERFIRPLIHLGLLVALIGLLGAIKVLPVIEGTVHYHGSDLAPLVVRTIQHNLAYDVFFDRVPGHEGAPTQHGKPEGWENISMYVGMVPAAFALLGLFVAPRKVRGALIVLALAFLILGEGTLYDMWLRGIGELRSLFRLPSRSLVVLMLAMGISAAFAIDWLRRRFRVAGLVFIAACIAWSMWDLGIFAHMALGRIEEIPPIASMPISPRPPVIASMSMHDAHEHPFAVLDTAAMVEGTCPDFNNTPVFIRKGYTGPIISNASKTPMEVVALSQGFTITPSHTPDTISVRSAYSPLLRVEGGTVVPLIDGSFSVLMPAGSDHVRITYQSAVALVGAVLSIATLAAFVVLK